MDLHGFRNRREGNVLCLCENTRVSVLLVLFHESPGCWPGQDLSLCGLKVFCITARLEVPRLLLRNEGDHMDLSSNNFYSGSLSFWLLQNLDSISHHGSWSWMLLAPSLLQRQVWMVEILRKIRFG